MKIVNYLIFVFCAAISAAMTARLFGDKPNWDAGVAVMFGLMAVQHALIHAFESRKEVKNESKENIWDS